jgi:Leucine rich repeat variant
MLFLVGLVLVPVLLIGYLVLAVRHFRRRERLLRSAVSAALTLALAAFPVWCAVLTWWLIADPSSTAVVGIYAVPLVAAVLAGLVFAVVWSALALARLARPGARGRAGWGRALLALLLLAGLSTLAGLAVRQELLLREAERSSTSPSRLAELFARETVQGDAAIVAAIAANPSTPGEVLAVIAAAPRPEWRAPRAGWLRNLLLAPSSRVWSVAAALAGNPNAPPEVLRRLADAEAEVAFRLARNPSAPPGVLTSLAGRPEASVRSAVAANPRTPAGTLVRLAGDGERSVRRVLAANAAAPPAALSALARDADRDTRLLVASNPNTPGSALELLTQDSDEKVRTYAARALQNPGRR